jgi:hypothetical protein
MKYRWTLWSGHLLLLILLADGIQWLVHNYPRISDFNLFLALAATIVIVINHFRWLTICRRANEKDLPDKTGELMIANYSALILIFLAAH